MSAKYRAATLADLAPGSLRRIRCGEVDVCLARMGDGSVHAVQDPCSHEGESLSEGEIIGGEVECPLHSSRFDLRTGEPRGLPAVDPVRVYPVDIRGEDVYIEV